MNRPEQAISDGYGTVERHVGECRTCGRVVSRGGSWEDFSRVEDVLASHIDDGSACHGYTIQAVYAEGGERRVA